MDRFPARTLILMVLALLAFGWFWWRTHRAPSPASQPLQLEVIGTDGGGS